MIVIFIGIISVDNYDDVTRKFTRCRVSSNTFVAGLFLGFAKASIFIIDANEAIVLPIHQLQCLDRIHGSKVSVLDDFPSSELKRGLPL